LNTPFQKVLGLVGSSAGDNVRVHALLVAWLSHSNGQHCASGTRPTLWCRQDQIARYANFSSPSRVTLVAVREPVEVWFGGRRRSQLAADSLDADTSHALQKVWSSTQEELVVISVAVVASSQPAEAIEIDLTLEGGQLSLTEVPVYPLKQS
jgi:hypothetical protein